jgi:beta-lactamase superfamily II metal-dependent hydrolase
MPQLFPPRDGATVRMYRTGHGDCFLLAFPGKSANKPVYVLIDCGYKPGSPAYIKTEIKDIIGSTVEATGGHVDVAVITHEHQDHVNGITAANFQGLAIGEAWFAWTEDPSDDLASALRKKFNDKILGLLGARNKLAAANDSEQVKKIDEFLAFELGGSEDEPFNINSAASPAQSMNKRSMKIFKDLAEKNRGVKFIRPHEKILTIPDAKDLRVFALGPPRDVDLIADMDPQGDESFHSLGIGATSADSYFSAAATTEQSDAPFARRFCIPQASAMANPDFGQYLTQVYGQGASGPSLPLGVETPGSNEVSGNADWRRIDRDWLYSADQLALAMNVQTNNASLVLAFELGKSGKVLLFAADAQRGNWVSWSKKNWKDGCETITARDLLSRTVLYKVGHHGSHNATLNGNMDDEHANLSWMAEGDYLKRSPLPI